MGENFINSNEFQDIRVVLSKTLEQVYSDINAHILNNSMSKDCGSFQISFDGIIAAISEEDIDIDIQQIFYVPMTTSDRIQDLEAKSEQIKYEIDCYKIKFKELIDMAGDIDSEFQKVNNIPEETKAIEIIDMPTSIGMEDLDNIPKSALRNQIVSQFNPITTGNSLSLIIEQKKSEFTKDNQIKFGGLSISVNVENDITKKLKLELINSERILNLYALLCIEKTLPNHDSLKIYKKQHEKGVAIQVETSSYRCKGFAKGNCVYDCDLEDTKGTKMKGKIINGLIVGTGTYRLANGHLFKGEILENLTVVGEIIDGNIKTVGKWNIVEVDHEYRIELSGDFKRYIDDKLYLEGKYEGATFTGKIHKADGEIISGVWTKGDFLNVKYAKGNQITEITRISENSFTWENYEKSVLIKKFTVVNNQLEGDFYSKTDKGTIRSKYKNGIITWAKLDEKSAKVSK